MTQSTNGGEYAWVISDTKTLAKIKNAKKGQSITSPIFNLNPFKCSLKLYPNGARAKQKETVDLFLTVHIPSKISSTNIRYWLILSETGTEWVHSTILTPDDKTSGWAAHTLKRSEILNLNTLTINVRIEVIKIHDNSE
eukprot:311079_1